MDYVWGLYLRMTSLQTLIRCKVFNLTFRLFARYMSKNEDLFKARLKMQQSLSHGAQSPKLSKMLEVLIDHFSMWHALPPLPFF